MVLSSVEKYVEKANLKHVQIHQEEIKDLVGQYGDKIRQVDVSRTLELMPKDLSWPEIVELFGVFNTVNFCYWPDKKEDEHQWIVKTEEGEELTSSEALLYSLAHNLPLDSWARFIKNIDEKEFKERVIPQGKKLPLVDTRWSLLERAAQQARSFYEMSKQCRFNAQKIVSRLADTDFFADFTETKYGRVWFLKRAQLFAQMLWRYQWSKKGIAVPWNMGQLTLCVDYKLPQILRHLGVLEYSPNPENSLLAQKVDNQMEIPYNSKEEVEIRIATIWAGEMIKREFHRQGRVDIHCAHIDHWLWEQSRKMEEQIKCHHRTITWWY